MDDKTKGIDPERAAGRSDEYVSGREALDTDGRLGGRATSRIPDRPGDGGRMHAPESARNHPPSSAAAAPDARARQIRADIEHTRGEMSETVNAIQDRLRPSNLAADAAESVKNSVRQAAGEQARAVADTARDLVDSEPVQYARANPIPTAMVGIGLAGLAWLAFGGRDARSSGYRAPGQTARDWRRLGPYDEADRFYRSGSARASHGAPGVDARSAAFGDAGFGEATYPGQGGYEEAAAYRSDFAGGSAGSSWTSEGADQLSGMADAAADYGRRARRTGQDATRKVQRAWQENPLLLGAASAVLGLMVGMAVPETEIENEYMGEARDHALEEVQQTVRETVGKVQNAASSAVDLLAGNDASSQGSNQGSKPAASQDSKPAAGGATDGKSSASATPATPVRNQDQKPLGAPAPKRNPGIG